MISSVEKERAVASNADEVMLEEGAAETIAVPVVVEVVRNWMKFAPAGAEVEVAFGARTIAEILKMDFEAEFCCPIVAEEMEEEVRTAAFVAVDPDAPPKFPEAVTTRSGVTETLSIITVSPSMLVTLTSTIEPKPLAFSKKLYV